MKKVAISILSLLLALYAAPANAVIVTAASGESGCNQNVGNAINVSAYRISNGDCVVEFRNVGTTTWTVPTGVTTISYLVVAGGGGGAGGQASEHGGGGGGAGGVVTGSTTVSTGNLSIVVGGGGNGGVANAVGTSGGDSMLAGLVTAFGGGRGGTYFTNAATVGGSGGGAGSGENRTGANGSTGQGNKGGNVTSSLTYGRHGGGGGGASAAGGNTTSSGGYTITAGAGGNGLASSITGTSTTYGGGGGGGGSSGGGGGSGATGGGSGGTGGGGSGATYNGTSLTSAATAGASNTGGGGGGGIGTGGSTASTGAAGGSGIIVVRYQPGPVNSNAPTITGTPQYGETLTANIGSWLYSPLSYTFQWMRSSTAGGSYTNISGATSSTYIPTATDINQYLKVAVTAANVNGSSSSNAQATAQVTKGATNQTLTIAPGDLIYRTSTSLTATVSTGGKLTFRANRESIPGCKNLVVSPANSYTRSCTYKPSRHGFVVITVIFTPTDPNFDAAISSSGSFFVKKRTGIR